MEGQGGVAVLRWEGGSLTSFGNTLASATPSQ